MIVLARPFGALLSLACAWLGINVNAAANGPVLQVNGQTVAVFRDFEGITTPAERAANVALRIARLSRGVSILATGNQVFVGGLPVMTARPKDAASNHMSPQGLAQMWSHNLRVAISIPDVEISGPSSMIKGQQAKLMLGGALVSNATVESSDEQVVKLVHVGNTYLLKAVGPGQANITASVPGTVRSLSINVKAFAAYFPQSVRGTVVGAPAIEETVMGALEGAVMSQVSAENGADLKIVDAKPVPLATGQSRTFFVRVRAFGNDLVTNEGNVAVTLDNLPFSARRESELWFCNSPERIKSVGPLFAATLKADSPVRVLYHHINDTSGPLLVKLMAVNTSSVPARIVITPGDSDPERNPVKAGIVAANRFVKAWRNGSGEAVTIPPNSSLPIAMRRLYPGQTVSGICMLRLLGGPESLDVREDAKDLYNFQGRWASAIASPAPWRWVGATRLAKWDPPARESTDQIYPNPFQEVTAHYTAGGKVSFIRIGQKPIERKDKNGQLDGNYGVIYNARFFLENSTALPTDVEFTFEASGGYSGALVILDGQIVQTPLLQPHQTHCLQKIRLEPQQTKEISFTTVPLSGSAYPCTFMIRPVGSTQRYGTTPLEDRT